VPPHILWTRSLYQGWTTLRLVRLQLESGDVIDREVEDHGNAVAVLTFVGASHRSSGPHLAGSGLPQHRTHGALGVPGGFDGGSRPGRDRAPRGLRRGRPAVARTRARRAGLDLAGNFHGDDGSMDLYLAPYSGADREHAGGGLASEHEHIEVTELSLDHLYAHRVCIARMIAGLRPRSFSTGLQQRRRALRFPDERHWRLLRTGESS